MTRIQTIKFVECPRVGFPLPLTECKACPSHSSMTCEYEPVTKPICILPSNNHHRINRRKMEVLSTDSQSTAVGYYSSNKILSTRGDIPILNGVRTKLFSGGYKKEKGESTTTVSLNGFTPKWHFSPTSEDADIMIGGVKYAESKQPNGFSGDKILFYLYPTFLLDGLSTLSIDNTNYAVRLTPHDTLPIGLIVVGDKNVIGIGEPC